MMKLFIKGVKFNFYDDDVAGEEKIITTELVVGISNRSMAQAKVEAERASNLVALKLNARYVGEA